MCRQSMISHWFRFSWWTWVTELSHKYQAVGVSTVLTFRKMKCGQTQCVLCVSVSTLSVIYQLNKVYSGRRENQVQPCEPKKMRKFTAGVEEEEIRVVYVPCPIHLHWVTFMYTWRKRAVPLAPLSVLLKHKHVPLPSPDNSPACLLSVFVQI